MNIFVTANDPIRCAINLDDKRVRHMSKESVELLGIFIHSVTGKWLIEFPLWDADKRNEPNFLYNHPVSRWVRRDRANMSWLFKHTRALIDEEVFRFDTIPEIEKEFLKLIPQLSVLIVDKQPKHFQNSSLFKDLPVIEAYRKTMKEKWFKTDKFKPVKWTRRTPPEWLVENKQMEL